MEIQVGKTAGFCYGVKRAVEGADEQLTKDKQVCCLGEIVHNHEVIHRLKEKGMEFVDDLKQANGKLLIRAHGIEKKIYEMAKKKNIELIDYTCPNVLRIHQIAEQYNQKGYFIILLGNKNHPENIGTISYCGKNCFVLKQESELDEAINVLQKTKLQKVLVISQTTYCLEKFEKIVQELKQKLLPTIILEIQNTICKATEVRQKETEQMAKNVDGMIIIGGKHSSNTQKLYQIACQYCKQVINLENEDELAAEMLMGKEKIGIMAGASTPDESIKKVVEKIKQSQKEVAI